MALNFTGRKPLNFIRFGMHRNKVALKKSKDYFDGICIPAHLLSYYENSLTIMLYELEKPFFIDPMTYLFNQNLDNFKTDNGTLKISLQKLIKIYGDKITDIIINQDRPYEPSDFDDNCCNELTQRAIIFQCTQSRNQLKEVTRMINKYKLDIDFNREPEFLVQPYFYFDDTGSEWYNINLKLAQCSVDHKSDHNLFAVICTNLSTIANTEKANKIVEDYSGLNIDGFIVWINGFNQYKANIQSSLIHVKNFIAHLSQNNKPIILMYGSYFAAILKYYGLSGFIHGIHHGENKPVDSQVGGGPIPSRYYLSKIHKFILDTKLDDFKLLLINKGLLDCNCDFCTDQKLKNWQEFLDLFNARRSQNHFLFCRHNELLEISTKSKEDIIAGLQQAYQSYDKLFKSNRIDDTIPDLSYLKNWYSTLQD